MIERAPAEEEEPKRGEKKHQKMNFTCFGLLILEFRPGDPPAHGPFEAGEIIWPGTGKAIE